MKNEERLCPYCQETFQPSRKNQIYCSYECQYSHYNERKALRREEAQKTINKILKNWEALYSVMSKNQLNDCTVDEAVLLKKGFTPGYITHMGADPADQSKIYCICEFCYKINGRKYNISKVEKDES
jgi:hypothetical protein